MKLDLRYRKKPINFFGTVENFFLKYMYCYQIHDVIQNCSINCSQNGKIVHKKSEILNLDKTQTGVVVLGSQDLAKCSKCLKQATHAIEFEHSPVFFFVEPTTNIKIKELPKTLKNNQKIYRLLCAIIHRADIEHFVSIFELQKQFYLIDDLTPNHAKLIKPDKMNYLDSYISSALFYLETII